MQDAQIARKGNYMKNIKEFPFKNARRITLKEIITARKAIQKKIGKKRKNRGRPPKFLKDKYQPISIRLHPKIILWAQHEAKKRRVGYQTIINEILLAKAA